MKKSIIYSTYIAAICICHRSISSSAIAVYIHSPSQYIFIHHRSIYSRERLRSCHSICSEGRRAR